MEKKSFLMQDTKLILDMQLTIPLKYYKKMLRLFLFISNKILLKLNKGTSREGSKPSTIPVTMKHEQSKGQEPKTSIFVLMRVCIHKQ